MKQISLLVCVFLLAGCAPQAKQSVGSTAPTDKEILDAYTYLYARYLVLQQEAHDINVEKVGYNKVKYNPLGSAAFVNPNLDVAYLEAWPRSRSHPRRHPERSEDSGTLLHGGAAERMGRGCRQCE